MPPIPAITRYLAAFLTAHRYAGDEGDQGTWNRSRQGREHRSSPARCTSSSTAACSNRRLRQTLPRCPPTLVPRSPSRPRTLRPCVLDNDRLDLAVARGAAYYGMVRRGEGVRIAASLARTYYIGIDSISRSPAPNS